MRFDQEVWQRLPVIERMGYTMDCLLDRARRFSDALRDANVPCSVCGGLSVMAWVETRDPSRARSTKDVDVLMRREDLPRAAEVLAPHGFVFVEVNGVPINYSPAKCYDSPFIQGDWGSGVVTIQKGDRKLTLDFNETPTTK